VSSAPPIHTFNRWAREAFGAAVGKVMLHPGHPCPHRSATGGCAYCRPESFTPFYLQEGDSLERQFARGVREMARKRFDRFLLYLQQETVLASDLQRHRRALGRFLARADCCGLVLATRPDQVNAAFVEGAAELAGSRFCLVEVGLQSAHDTTLRRINRGHDVAAFREAAALVRRAGLELGVHLILGLPGEDEAIMRGSIEAAVAAGATHLKLHHLQVIEGTAVARWYARGEVEVMDAESYLQLLARLLPYIPQGVVLDRLWSMAAPELLVAPRWRCFSYTLMQRLLAILEAGGLRQGCLAAGGGT